MDSIKQYDASRNSVKQILDSYTFEDLDKLIEESTGEKREIYKDMKNTKQIFLESDIQIQKTMKEFNELTSKNKSR